MQRAKGKFWPHIREMIWEEAERLFMQDQAKMDCYIKPEKSELREGGMTFYQIGKELSVDDSWVLAHINVFKFPDDIQDAVWSGDLSISHIQRLEPVIGANVEDATRIAREIMLRRISVSQTEELIKDRKEAIEKARMEAAKKAVGVMTPMAEIKLETPEDFERTAEVLRKEAKRKREAKRDRQAHQVQS